jgi:paraquat-inducible protein A
MFAGLVFLTVIHDRWMCRWSVWHALERGYGARKARVAA